MDFLNEKALMGISYFVIIVCQGLLVVDSGTVNFIVYSFVIVIGTILIEIASLSIIQKSLADPLQDYTKAVVCCKIFIHNDK